MAEEPNWPNPHHPAWDDPPHQSYSAENLIALGNATYGDEALLWNDAIAKGVRAMFERGYVLDNNTEVSQVIDETFGERGHHFTKRPEVIQPERGVHNRESLTAIACEEHPDLPGDMHPNLLLEMGIQALVAQGWHKSPETAGYHTTTHGLEQLWVYERD